MTKLRQLILVFMLICLSSGNAFSALDAPHMTLTPNGLNISVSWTEVPGAAGYMVYYAPYPDASYIGSADLGSLTGFSLDLWDGAAFYMAVQAYSAQEFSNISNIDYFVLSSGGGGDGNGTQAVLSYSPVFVNDSSGNPLNARWEYLINGGAPLSFQQNGISVNVSFTNLILEIDRTKLTRTASFTGTITGGAPGDLRVDVMENLSSSDTKTLINSQNFDVLATVDYSGMEVGLGMVLDVNYDTPVEWFLDRSDLDTLPIGYVYDEQGQISGTASGNLIISYGPNSQSIPVNTSITSPEKWEIIGHEDSRNVLGVDYTDIVVVKRSTTVPVADGQDAVKAQIVEMTYWVARGVGMIRGEGQYDFQGHPLTLELVKTNLP